MLDGYFVEAPQVLIDGRDGLRAVPLIVLVLRTPEGDSPQRRRGLRRTVPTVRVLVNAG